MPSPLLLLPLLLPPLLFHLLRLYLARARAALPPTVAFLHPEALNGGGGERVLWVAVCALSSLRPDLHIAVLADYPSGGHAAAAAAVSTQFNLTLPAFSAVALPHARLADASRYPRLTLLLQAVGATVLGGIAYARCPAHVVVDTANQAFSLLLPRLLGARTAAYVHYPTVCGEAARGGRARRAYVGALVRAYGVAGRAAHARMANSSWTRARVARAWGVGVERVYPPVDVGAFAGLALDGRRRGLVVSVGQFRPEKDHARQLRVAGMVRARGGSIRLVIVGGARHAGDWARVARLKRMRSEMGLDGCVELRVNARWEELVELLGRAWAGVHTMEEEHFGISVVELLAAGVVPVAHRSGGVAEDIVTDGVNGYLARSDEEYADALLRVLGAAKDDVDAMRRAARSGARKFSDDAFARAFVAQLGALA